MTSIIEQQNTIQTTDLDIIPEDDVTKGIKRPAPASDASDTESDVPQEPVKRKKQTTSYNWGALYWQNPNNGYTIVYDEKSKQFNFQTPAGKRFAFTTPGTKALCKFLRRGGNHGAFTFSKTEESASINTMMIYGSIEKYADLHNEFKKYVQHQEDTLLEAMWNNQEMHDVMMKRAEELMNLPQGSTEEEKQQRAEKMEKIAFKLFKEGAQHVVKDDGDTWNLNAKTRAYYETIRNSGQYRPQEIIFFNGATPEGEAYEKFDDDYTLGNVAMLSLVLKPQGFTTPGFAKYGISYRLGHEVVVFKDLGSTAELADRDTLMDINRPFTFTSKVLKSGQTKLYCKDQAGSDYTFIAEAPVKYSIESNLNKFDGKIKKDTSKYEGTLIPSDELTDFVKRVEAEACKALLANDDILAGEKDKLRKTAEMIEKPFEEVFRSKFQSPIHKEYGTLKVSKKEFYENRDTPGEWNRQPFPIEDDEGNLLEGEDKIASESVVQIPLKFSVYTLSSGIFGMKMEINTRYTTCVVEEAGFVKGAPAPPKFDF
jgi:hypothetical protein